MTFEHLVLFCATCLAAALFAALNVVLFRARAYWRRRFEAERRKLSLLRDRFAVIVDADEEALRIVTEAQVAAADIKGRVRGVLESVRADHAQATAQLEQLKKDYADKKVLFDKLAHQVAVFDERIAFAELGIYKPHFDFDSSEAYKAEIEKVRGLQKAMVSNKTAVLARTNWTVDGSAAKGRTMTDRAIRLTLRAFNGECDAAVANVRWNNVNAMEKRIENARTQIDKHNESNALEISQSYFDLKLKELRLTHEQREKVKAEREERAEAARNAREEEKLIREMERAEDEEARYQRLLQKAEAEAASSAGPKLEALANQIASLERDLKEAHARAERARAMAEMTKSGYVYVISNIGSFGPDFVKIGLTRRLDPADRIRELGDASVPFLFDTHAVIYSDDAPALERSLHTSFADRRVNATNMRKEFFRVSIEEVEAAVSRLAPQASFFRDIEAQEYYETLALRKEELVGRMAAEELVFPAAL